LGSFHSLPALDKLPYLKDRLDKLKKQYPDLTNYIYVSCRCAVAHAGADPIYDPENIEDEVRFYEIQPIAHALAKLIIENNFGIKSKFTLFRDHLYELEGFHQLVGDELSTRLRRGEAVTVTEIKFNSKISLRIWGKPKFKAFENLQATVVGVNQGAVTLSLTRDNVITFQIVLDFPNEKLIFDPMQSIDFNDNGSKNAALQFSNAYQFYSEFMGNPVLEVWETKSNKILGRLLEYLPKVLDI